MYCPRCGATQSEDIKFCKACGANLLAVRRAFDNPETDEKKFNWGDTWVADMFLSPEAQARRKAEIEMRLGITPETRRYNEIKAGVITSSVGVALMIFLYVFMEGIVLGGKVPPDAASILSRLWITGIIPFFIGVALMINGIVISKRLVEIANKNSRESASFPEKPVASALGSGETSEFIPTDYSVTEHTTKHLNAVRDRE